MLNLKCLCAVWVEQLVYCSYIEYLRGFEAFAQTSFTFIGSSSQSFEWKGYGLKLHVPEGAVPGTEEGCTINIKAGLGGQFEFPGNSQLVSCIYWLSCPQKFLEPVTLEIQHCGLIANSSQSSSLHFVVAKCSQPELPYKFKALDKGTFSLHTELLPHKFKALDKGTFSPHTELLPHKFKALDKGSFSPHSSYGSLRVSQFSFFGIFGECRPYYSAVYYINEGCNRWRVEFVMTLNLEVHLKVGCIVICHVLMSKSFLDLTPVFFSFSFQPNFCYYVLL